MRQDKTKRLLNPRNWIDPKTKERYRYFSRDGKGFSDVLKWANDFENNLKRDLRYKIVKQEYTFFGFFRISTVWLGIDYNFWGKGPPLLFETMVFYGDKDLDLCRYTTETQAREGHEELVKKWSNPFKIFWHFFYHEGLEDIYFDLKWKIKNLIKKYENKKKN